MDDQIKQLQDMQRKPLTSSLDVPFHERAIGPGQVGSGFLSPSRAVTRPPIEQYTELQRSMERDDEELPTEQQIIQLRARQDEILAELKMLQHEMTQTGTFARWYCNENPRLERNDCSRMHKLIDAVNDRRVEILGTDGVLAGAAAYLFADMQSFVVNHDWAAALGDDHESTGQSAEEYLIDFRLPFKRIAFEFRINGQTVLMLADEDESQSALLMNPFFAQADGTWLTYEAAWEDSPTNRFMRRQIRAICIALEAEVAVTEVVRAPAALNVKRVKNGKAKLADYSVIQLARRHRVAPREQQTETGRKVRLHYRRGHWRNYADHKTWIKWMLVGDPSLGFLAKHYSA